jgi:hypothetical protein
MKIVDAFETEKLNLTQKALLTTLGAAVAAVEVAVEHKSFLGDIAGVERISPAQKALLNTVGAVFAATNFFAGKDVASDIELAFRITKDVAMLGNTERISFGHRASGATSFVVNIIAAPNAASAGTEIAKGASASGDRIEADDTEIRGGNSEAPRMTVLAADMQPAGGCCYFVYNPKTKQWVCQGSC